VFIYVHLWFQMYSSDPQFDCGSNLEDDAMHTRKQQAGFTFWSFLSLMLLLSFLLYVGFRLFSPYLADFKVRAALESVAKLPDIGTRTKPEIASALEKRFDIDDVEGIKLNEALTVEVHGNRKVIRLKYEIVKPMFGNLSALMEFDHVKEVKSE